MTLAREVNTVEFWGWSFIGSPFGAVLTVILLTEVTKDLFDNLVAWVFRKRKPVPTLKTQTLAYLWALVFAFLVAIHAGGFDAWAAVLAFVNAAAVAFAAIMGWEKFKERILAMLNPMPANGGGPASGIVSLAAPTRSLSDASATHLGKLSPRG